MEINNKTFEDYAKILREAVPYNDNIAKIQFVTKVDKRRSDRIKKFYKEKAGLDLEALENSDLSTWEKTFELAQFVSKLVPHDNQEKWAMIDSDMTEYVVDEAGNVLSLFEMRDYICSGKNFEIMNFPGFEDVWNGFPTGKEFLKCYWAKNLYWFARHTTYGFSLESNSRIGDSYICLIPPRYDYKKVRECIETNNEKEFWDL